MCVGFLPLEPKEKPQTQTNIVLSKHFCGVMNDVSNGVVELPYFKRGDPEYLYVQVSLCSLAILLCLLF